MIAWLMKFVPASYSWGIAVKKVAYFAGKGAAALFTFGALGKALSGHFTPEQMTQIQTTAGLMAGGMLEALHDFLKLKYPNATWL